MWKPTCWASAATISLLKLLPQSPLPTLAPISSRRILAAFNDGMKHRPQTHIRHVNADVLEHFDPTFVRDNFVDTILNSTWPE